GSMESCRKSRSRSWPLKRHALSPSPRRLRQWSIWPTGCGSWGRSRVRCATSPPAGSTPSARSSRHARSTSLRLNSSSASAVSRSIFRTPRRSSLRRSTWRGVHGLSQRERPRYAVSWPTPCPRRLLRVELRVVEGRVLRRNTGTDVAPALRAVLRHGRSEQHLLPPATANVRHALGRRDYAGVRLCGQGEPLPHAREEADGSRQRHPALLRTTRTPRALTQAGPGPLAVACELPPQRRPARCGTRRVAAGPLLLRVPRPELVRPARLRAPPQKWSGTGDRRPSRGEGVPEPRAHHRLDVRTLPLRLARAARELQPERTGGMGAPVGGL